MTSVLDVMAVRATGDPVRAVFEAEPGGRVEEIACDVLVVGGGAGGISAALAAARELPAEGRVVLLEETDWIGGQLTAQGVSALDEHDHIERFGGTRSYYALREAIRDHYRRLSSVLARERHPNPGDAGSLASPSSLGSPSTRSQRWRNPPSTTAVFASCSGRRPSAWRRATTAWRPCSPFISTSAGGRACALPW